ncbi:M20 family metallopeptidase [Palaeococcus ferrophilus]|uniref:M20 family metallopeptidase n=1 Tax=Palaeococcus ferrophilus TaxID=83868 RepID=UPI00064F2AEF|nr:M20/M25/M40 family metallo-hydrolase [Palaeococcus ferrophilus]
MEAELLKEFVRIDSHFGHEEEISNAIASILEEYATVETQEVEGFGRNVIARIRGKKRTVLLNGHMDTVGLSDGWTRNPWGELDGDRFYGLGSADMKGGLAALMSAFIEVSQLPRKERPTVIFTAVVDEEGYSRGAWRLVESGIVRKADVALIAEPTNERLMLGARGRFVIQIEAFGKKAHATQPDSGANAVEDLAKVVGNIGRLRTKKHLKLGRGSWAVLHFEGSADGLSIPEYAKAIVDRHVVPGEEWDRVKGDIEKLISKLDLRSRVVVSRYPRPTPEMLPYLTRENSTYAQRFKETYGRLFGETPEVTYGRSVGDFNYFGAYLKVPTLVFGPIGGNWHAADEWVSLSSVRRVKRLYVEFLRELAR